jgi:hypothetical protein
MDSAMAMRPKDRHDDVGRTLGVASVAVAVAAEAALF